MKTRKILSLLLAAVMLMSLASFASAEAAYTQSPYLDGQDLPAVADRLPAADDIMVEDLKDVGRYTDHITLAQGGSKWGPGKPTEEALFRFRTDGTVEPNVAKGFEVNDDKSFFIPEAAVDNTLYQDFIRQCFFQPAAGLYV